MAPLDSTNKPSPRDAVSRVLIGLARDAIAQSLDLGRLSTPPEPWLRKTRASFVTLKRDGELRGCIGSLTAHRPLLDDLITNACNAAFKDPRFGSLMAQEFPQIRVEVSLLSPPSPIAFRDQRHALAQLQPFLDGVILEYGRHRSTFLPQVWAHLPEPSAFLANLKVKAGLAADFWAQDLRLYRYRATKFLEPI